MVVRVCRAAEAEAVVLAGEQHQAGGRAPAETEDGVAERTAEPEERAANRQGLLRVEC